MKLVEFLFQWGLIGVLAWGAYEILKAKGYIA